MNLVKCQELLNENTIGLNEYNLLTSKCWLSQFVLMYLDNNPLGIFFARLKIDRLIKLGLINESDYCELLTNLGLSHD